MGFFVLFWIEIVVIMSSLSPKEARHGRVTGSDAEGDGVAELQPEDRSGLRGACHSLHAVVWEVAGTDG